MDDFDLGLLVGLSKRAVWSAEGEPWRGVSCEYWSIASVLSSSFRQDDTDYKVTVLRQKMLGMFPVFMYRVKEKQPGQEYLYVDLCLCVECSILLVCRRLTLSLDLHTLLLVCPKLEKVPTNGTCASPCKNAVSVLNAEEKFCWWCLPTKRKDRPRPSLPFAR